MQPRTRPLRDLLYALEQPDPATEAPTIQATPRERTIEKTLKHYIVRDLPGIRRYLQENPSKIISLLEFAGELRRVFGPTPFELSLNDFGGPKQLRVDLRPSMSRSRAEALFQELDTGGVAVCFRPRSWEEQLADIERLGIHLRALHVENGILVPLANDDAVMFVAAPDRDYVVFIAGDNAEVVLASIWICIRTLPDGWLIGVQRERNTPQFFAWDDADWCWQPRHLRQRTTMPPSARLITLATAGGEWWDSEEFGP